MLLVKLQFKSCNHTYLKRLQFLEENNMKERERKGVKIAR